MNVKKPQRAQRTQRKNKQFSVLSVSSVVNYLTGIGNPIKYMKSTYLFNSGIRKCVYKFLCVKK